MDDRERAEAISQIVEWFTARIGDAMTASVVMGADSRSVATGPFLRLEEHPESKGVYRAVFDDSLAGGAGATQFVAFGSELQEVAITEERVTLDKGTQRIEVVDHARRQMDTRATADDVIWPETSAAPPAPVTPEYPPSPIPAATASPLPASAPRAMASAMPPPAQAPGGAEGLVLSVKAPLYSNSLQSGFFGDVTLGIRQGWMSVSGTRASKRGTMLVAGVLLMVFGALGLLLGVALSTAPDASLEHMGALFGMASLVALGIGVVLYFVGRSKVVSSGQPATVQFELARAQGRKVLYDSNTGCLWMLLLSPVIGLIIMLVMGRRIVRISAPIGLDGKMQMVVLRARSSTDGGVLARALSG